MNRNVQILSLEAKDLINNKCAIVDKLGKSEIKKLKDEEYRILTNYKGSLDYSLLTIYLQKNYENIIKYNKDKYRLYSNDIITVNFEYSIDNSKFLYVDEEYNNLCLLLSMYKSFNRKLKKVKYSLKGKINRLLKKEVLDTDKFNNLNKKLNLINSYIIVKEAYIEEISSRIKEIKNNYFKSTNELREILYEKGFTINANGKETHYCRFMRSSGSARVGKINFINSKYYDDIIEWCMAGIEYKDSHELDLPSLEAYISLVTSSIIDTFDLKPENILLIDDAESIFPDTVMATELINEVKDENGKVISGELKTKVAKKQISNKLFDGESLLSKEVFQEKGYGDKAILQIRNRFFKGIGINTDIQKFFDENGITSISQLKGKTLATNISQIKLITTKSSIKYMKYKEFEEWLKVMNNTWGICKYEKPQHNFNNMANTHYQLLNSLGLSKEAMKELLDDTISYINLLKNDISIFKLHLGLIKDGALDELEDEMSDEEVKELDNIKTNTEFMLNMLKINEDFSKTKICRQYRYEVINNYIKNVKRGRVLVNGTYATVINSAYEYLLCSVGKWDGISSTLGVGECYSSKFALSEDILGVRSPQPTMSNMTVFKNVGAGKLADYFNIESENVVYISAIGWNIFELESSMDVDGDAMLLTNNKIITEHCKKLNEIVNVEGEEIKRFLVGTDFTPKTSINRSYTSKDLCVTDIKCSQGKIGECINLVQMLNSVYWTRKKQGATEKELLELYKDISNLNILSCIIIDSSKKSSPVQVDYEMNKIRAKGYLGKGTIIRNGKKKEVSIRPYFFKYLDGGKDYKFKPFECGMDYLVQIMNDKEILGRKDRDNKNGNIPLKSLLLKQKADKADRKKIQKLIKLISEMQIKISNIYKSKDEAKDKFRQAEEVRQVYFNQIKEYITSVMIYTIIKRLSDAYSTEDKYQEYKKIGRNILKTLYSLDSVKFLSCLQVKSNVSGIVIRDEDGEIDIYGVKYKKMNM